jgi:glycosyltransferase involved in cell wall biosynthesis
MQLHFAWDLLVSGTGIFLAAVWLYHGTVVWLNRKTVPDIAGAEYTSAQDILPRISIIVPARNEAEHIEAGLLSLLQLDYPDYEVIAVNDRSEDATGAIMDRLASEWRSRGETSHHLLKVMHVTELPEGWLGKVHAMWRATQQASGEWLLFTDADVVFRADALRRAIVYGERESADHVVLFPTMTMKSVGERMMIAFFSSQFVFAHRPWKVSDPQSRDSIGVGAFNMVRRAVYEQIGTYSALRMAVLDDMKLGELVKRNGFRQRCSFGPGLLWLRWVVGATGMVRNLTKNFFAILHFNVWFAIVAICGVLLINAVPFIGIWFAHGWGRAGYVISSLAIFVMYTQMARRSEFSWTCFFLHPLAALVFAFAMIRSMVITIARGGIEWRGTFYSLEELRAASDKAGRRSWL